MPAKRLNKMPLWQWTLCCVLCVLMAAPALYAQAPAGYSEYYIPADEENLLTVLEEIGGGSQGNLMHSVITVTGWSDDTVIYYDHWEDGYDFDPNDPTATADEIVTLANRGDSQTFESSNINANPRDPAQTYYDGGDRIYIAGGSATVTRSGWTEDDGTLLSVAWEVYPVRPQLTTYILPFGEDLAPALNDFERVFALVQATSDNTVVEFDLDGDGVVGDTICISRDAPCTTTATQVTLNAGEVFLLDQDVASPTSSTLNTGTIIEASDTIQVQYIIGDEGSTFEIRGLSAFPRGFWDDEYYAPVDSANTSSDPTDIYLHNPHGSVLTINWETTSGSGTFTINPGETVSFRDETGSYVPQDSAVYLNGSDVFWGVSTIDVEGSTHDWGYSLVPAFLLEDEYFMGWAPGSTGAASDDSGIFVAPAQDNTRIFVDFDNDGIADQTYDLDRLETQYIYDPTDGDLSEANIWATGPFTVAYGQNPDTSAAGAPAIDVGYTTLPGGNFIENVLTVEKTTDPALVSTSAGAQTTFSLEIDTYDFSVDGINVVDTLPSGWQYVDDSTTITLADNSTISGNSADPAISGGGVVLTWDSALLADMAENQTITIVFTAETTQDFNVGDITRNVVEASGTRTVGIFPNDVTQTFVTSDFVFNTYGDPDMEIEKSSSGVDPLYPGDTYTYTVTITNPASSGVDLTGIGIYDPLPEGVSYVAGSSYVDLSGVTVTTYSYDFESGDQGFTATGIWERGDPTTRNPLSGGSCLWSCYGNGGPDDDHTDSGVNAWGTDLDDLYSNGIGGGIYLYSPVYDFSGMTSIQLSYWEWLEIEGSNFDYARLQRRVGAGAWTNVWVYGDNEWWSREDSSWSQYVHDASAYAANQSQVQWRWMLQTDWSWQWAGWYIDDVLVQASDDSPPYPGPAHDPPNFVTIADGYVLEPGETLTLTFDVTIDDPLASGIEEITNTASVTTNEFPLPLEASVTNIVVNPGAESAEVGDRVWFDLDGDGVYDVGEPGLSGVEVILRDQYGAPVLTTSTDALGNYLFTDIEPGNGYYVEVNTDTLPSGLQQSAPSGHSDDRTDSFDLAAGDSYLDADLGYTTVPGTATIGDLVWSDADGDGTRDSDEPGIGGVQIQLYLDDGDGVFEPGGDDGAALMTTTTAADGSYLFSGIAPGGSQDYFVYIDESQAVLSGYTRRNPGINPPLVSNLNADDAILDIDFGYQPDTLYIYRDRLWFDDDSDQNDDNSGGDNAESGLVNVTVDLLDASLNVIATTTSDADGYFSFAGLAGNGADYTVQITDTNGVLGDYYGTTAAATAGSFELINVGTDLTDLDYTDEAGANTDPNFGYNLSGSIGDTVFNDSNGNGTQDSGELGISGVVVELFLDDGTPVATLTTDANGNYIFSGLDDGNYVVEIDNTQSALSGYDTLTTGDDDAGAAGHQRNASISGGNNILDIDFGYQSSNPRSVSGTIWEDIDEDGVIDGSETFPENVTVELWQNGSAIAVTATDSNGDYSFTGLPSGIYTVRVTDDNGVLNGYYATYEVTEGTSSPFNNQEIVDVSGGDQGGINFGFSNPAATLVVLSSFGAYEQGGQVIIHWETSAEVGTIGFYLERLDETQGQYVRLDERLLPALFTTMLGGSYRFVDPEALPGIPYSYRLVEVEIGGNTRLYGPFRVTAESKGSTLDSFNLDTGFKRTPRQRSTSEIARTRALQDRKALYDRIRKYRRWQQRIKISVQEKGLYVLEAEKIAELLGLSQKQTQRLIKSAGFSLSNRGQEVAYLPSDDNRRIYFYAEGIDSMYSKDNIYWLEVGRGKHIRHAISSSAPMPVDGTQSFRDQLHFEQDTWAPLSSFDDPDDDFWIWEYLYAGFPGYDIRSLNFIIHGIAEQGDATLTLDLKGGAGIPGNIGYHARVTLNGSPIGEGSWSHSRPYELVLPFDQSLLNAGENTLEIQALLDEGVPFSLFFINAFDLQFQRYYQAHENVLFARGDEHPVVTASGFSEADPRVFDITDSHIPRLIEATSTDPSLKRVSFRPESPTTEYLILPLSRAREPEALFAVSPPKLKKERNGADYVVIAPLELKGAAQTLADYRQAQGLTSLVVEPEEIYNEFNDGIVSPEAIQDFLAFSYCNWNIAPRYVVLAGEGTYDYKDNQGYGDNLIPPFMVATPHGIYSSDTRFGDIIDDDGVPEIAVGRLPVVTPDELYAVLEKIQTYEQATGVEWKNRVLMLSDNQDAGGNFPASSEQVSALLPQTLEALSISLADSSLEEARENLFSTIHDGIRMLNYIGHGSTLGLAAEGLLTVQDIENLQNSGRSPVLTALTCSVGMFAYPGYDSLSEGLLLKKAGGAVAVWSPSGMSLNREATFLNTLFFRAAFEKGEHILGDIILDTLKSYGQEQRLPFLLDIYSLLGDPALQLSPGGYARRDERTFDACRQELQPGSNAVTIWKKGNGTGALLTNAGACGPDCQTLTIPYAVNDFVLLEAFPAEGSYFAGWTREDGFFIETPHYYPLPGEVVIAVFRKK